MAHSRIISFPEPAGVPALLHCAFFTDHMVLDDRQRIKQEVRRTGQLLRPAEEQQFPYGLWQYAQVYRHFYPGQPGAVFPYSVCAE